MTSIPVSSPLNPLAVTPTAAVVNAAAISAPDTVEGDTIAVKIPTPNAGSSSVINSLIPRLKAHEQMEIGFADLNYRITAGTRKAKKVIHILKGVSAQFARGRLIVILGASGAGKTSLLNVLAGETKVGEVAGSLYINGKPSNGATMKKVSAFVHQDDVVLGTMTVLEAITMSAHLRLPDSLSVVEKAQKVDEIISMLGLEKCRNTIIGTATEKGISGGERKRACMAMELITNPSIVFLDEPTSGLDTYTAFAVVKLLKDLASSGRTVIATLHQPSSEIFHLIDDLCIMSQGEIMYYGEAENSVAHFAKLGYKCPQYSNPADYFFMEILNTTATGDKDTDQQVVDANPKRISGLLQAWKDGDRHKQMMADMTSGSNTGGVSRDNYKFVSTFGKQFPILFRRAFYNAFRNKLLVRAKLAQNLFMAIIMGLIYLDLPGRKLAAQVQDRSGALFFISINMVMSNAMGVLSIFAAEKQVFQREYGARYYGLPAYFLSKQTVELPFQLLLPFIFSCIFYWMIGLVPDAGRFFILSVFAILLSGCGTAIGTLAACAFSSLPVALAILPAILLPLMLFSGLFVNTDSIPVFLDWIKYLSPMKYGFTGLIKNEFNGLTQLCPRWDENQSTPCRSAASVIQQLGFGNQGSVGFNMLILLILWLGLLFASYFALWRIVRNAKSVDFTVPGDKKSATTLPRTTAN